jgi:hypothetical protein
LLLYDLKRRFASTQPNATQPAEKTQQKKEQTQQTEQNGSELDINTTTGEIGGPAGPEPTRFGIILYFFNLFPCTPLFEQYKFVSRNGTSF